MSAAVSELPVAERRVNLRPMQAPTALPDLRALRACWHPVAYADEITREPAGLELLNEPLVAWRGTDGAPRVLADLCVHRGTALSLGRVEGDEIVCPYHAGGTARTACAP